MVLNSAFVVSALFAINAVIRQKLKFSSPTKPLRSGALRYPTLPYPTLPYPTLPYPSGTLRERERCANGNAARTGTLRERERFANTNARWRHGTPNLVD